MFTSKWFRGLIALIPVVMLAVAVLAPVPALAVEGGDANLQLPDLGTVDFFNGTNGRTLLMGGLGVCALGLLFGLMTFTELKNMPVHASMLEELSLEDRINDEVRVILEAYSEEMRRTGANYQEMFRKVKSELVRKYKAVL